MIMAMELTVTAKGQVTLRQAVLEHLGAKPGQKVGVALLPDGRVELRAVGAGAPLSRLRGILRHKISRSVTLEEMQEAIESVEYP
jgi:bifunctional DNA-binding transcriptional regulator/antitoxin component of YhaV-PrlF toxin-antitoxin module